MSLTSADSPARSKRPASFYKSSLDVLRFSAFLMVFFCHSGPTAPVFAALHLPLNVVQWIVAARRSGAFGVDLFFVLSSFLITELLRREFAARGSIDVRAFYARRVLRIWPLYFAFLAFTFWIAPAILLKEAVSPTNRVLFVVFAANWAIDFLPFRDSIANILWSVSIEEQFYLAWPWAARFGPRVVGWVAVALLPATTLFRVLFLWTGKGTMFHNTLTHLDPIACGALLSVVLNGRSISIRRPARLAIFAAGVGIIVCITKWGDPNWGSFEGKRALFAYPIVACACAAMVLAALASPEGEASLVERIAVRLGRISYGLYVFHMFALSLFRQELRIADPVFQWIAVTGGAFCLTIVAALASYRWIELPFLKLKDRFTYVNSRGPVTKAERASKLGASA